VIVGFSGLKIELNRKKYTLGTKKRIRQSLYVPVSAIIWIQG
jgi:hypothetical protein